MNNSTNAILSLAFTAFVSSALFASGTVRTNPPGCDPAVEDCGCDKEQVSAECIKVRVDLGETTPWTGSLGCSLKIFADDDSPSIFTPESLHAVLGGYTFKRLGQKTMSDGVTPAEVVLSHPNGEAVHFVFANGESLGRPDPGVHIKMDARLQMVDSEGWATTHDPVYYDLYVGDGTKRRFLATNMTGALGALVSITDERGVVRTPADMGVDIIYDPDGVRQYLTPSRLANVTRTADFLGYDVAIYAIQEPPQKDAATGMYPVPAGQTVEHVSVRRENGGKRAVVTIRKGGGEPLRYVFDYAMNEWSLTRPSGMQERKECIIADGRAAQITKTDVSSAGEVLAKKVKNYKWMSWGFAMTNRVEGFGGVTDTTTWTYYTSGNGKGQVKSEKRQSGLLTQYVYDNLDRVVSKTRSGPDMMTEVTTYDYTPVDPSDPVLPVDTRPRTVVRKLNNIECERTYYVYSPLTNIVERVGTQGAAYGGTNALRTITVFYPVVVGADLRAARSGFVQSIRHEDGKLDLYDYELSSNIWVRAVTHLHEQSPSPVSGKTTRDITVANRRGEILEQKTDAYIDGIWYTIARNQMTYNFEGKRTSLQNLAGQVTTTAWDCCHKVSETQPDGSTTTWDYDIEGRMIASSRLIPLDMTNVTWLTTCYQYDDLGRQVATWQTNYAAHVGLPVTLTRYDQLGRVIARVDHLGNTTTTSFSNNGRVQSVTNPNTSTVVYEHNADGDTLSITGTAVTPEFHTYGILPDGTRWSRTVQGETASSPRFSKRYENMLRQAARAEKSGFQGALLATINSYDSYGRLVSAVVDGEPATELTYNALGERETSVVRAASGEWRKNETATTYELHNAHVWRVSCNTVSCSDSAAQSLSQTRADRITGLSQAFLAQSLTTDPRGNTSESRTERDNSETVKIDISPAQAGRAESHYRIGNMVRSVTVSGVESQTRYDSLGRQIATIDGRGKETHVEYDAFGRKIASIDPDGNRTLYGFNALGELIAVTNAMCEVIVYEYDLRGRRAYEGGATYPVRYTYDIFGNKIAMVTYRDENASDGDETRWFYDEASNCMTNKVYAGGKGTSYNYDSNGRLIKRIWARGIETTYSYNAWGELVRTDYSDGTPSLILSYDAMGRQVSAIDAAGVTTFAYDIFGAITNETVVGVAGTNTIDHFYDAFGRDVGYALNGVRQSTLSYDPATGRIASMRTVGSDTPFAWNYRAGSDQKSSLLYPNGLSASWTYGNRGELLEVGNAFPSDTVSKYVYVYDAVGRLISCAKSGSAFDATDTSLYLYNARSELTNAIAAVDSDYRYAYDFDDIGNRETSNEHGTNSVYTANQLNQFTAVDDFIPQFDDDGNQTLIKTSTGIWSVTYNGENRPVRWENEDTVVTMSYDRMGRRVTKNNQRFVYDGYLQIANFEFVNTNSQPETRNLQHFIWDPTEKIATRPLEFFRSASAAYYIHDGSKNVSEVVVASGTTVAHYEYAPFGAVVAQSGERALENPWRFSCEFADDVIGLVYYNYRHYDPVMGRWLRRDPIEELEHQDIFVSSCYGYVGNFVPCRYDLLGMWRPEPWPTPLGPAGNSSITFPTPRRPPAGGIGKGGGAAAGAGIALAGALAAEWMASCDSCPDGVEPCLKCCNRAALLAHGALLAATAAANVSCFKLVNPFAILACIAAVDTAGNLSGKDIERSHHACGMKCIFGR